LVPDRVVAADDAVVQQGHMGCARGEDVGLLGLELGRGNQLHRGIGPGVGGCLRSHGEGRATEQKPDQQDGYRQEHGGFGARHGLKQMHNK